MASTDGKTPGEPMTMMQHVIDKGAEMMQSLKPVKQFSQHVCTFALYSHDMNRQIETHHYVHRVNQDFCQCAVYDTDDRSGRLIGVEYIISDRLFEALPPEEQKLWHSHYYEKGEALSGLHNLQSLQITGVPKMSCLPKGMKSASNSLKYLHLGRNECLNEIPSWLTSFTSLEILYIVDCPKLLALPEGFSNLKSLRELVIVDCPHLIIRCAKPDGEDFSLIQHIPRIILDGDWL